MEAGKDDQKGRMQGPGDARQFLKTNGGVVMRWSWTQVLLSFNAFLTLLIFVVVLFLAWRGRKEVRIAGESDYYRVVVPLLAATALWFVEYLLFVFRGEASHAEAVPSNAFRVADYLLNSLVSLGFFFGGWTMLRLKGRLHPVLRSATRSPRVTDKLVLIVGSELFLHTYIATVTVLLAASTLFLIRPDWPAVGAFKELVSTVWSDDPSDGLQTLTACVGLVTLGLGLYRQLSMERSELVTTICGASLVLYGLSQFARVDESHEGLYMLVRLFALLFKIAFVTSISAFWVVITQMNRVDREYRGIARTQGLFIGVCGQLHEVSHKLRLAVESCARVSQSIKQDDTSQATDTIGEIVTTLTDVDRRVRGVIDRGRLVLDDNVCPQGLSPYVLTKLLEWQTRRASDGFRAEPALRFPNPTPELPARIERSLALFATEAITNVLKHSNATHLTARLEMVGTKVLLTIEDDGDGIPEQARREAGFGHMWLQFLAQQVGAAIVPATRPAFLGTRITMSVDVSAYMRMESVESRMNAAEVRHELR